MAFTDDQELLEYELRVKQMQTNIGQMEKDATWETRKFVLQVFVGAAVCVGAGVALANYVNRKSPDPAPAPPPQIIYLVPGQAPSAPPKTP